MRRISILHYAGPPVVGGVEITIYHHARLLCQAGHQVQVIAGRGGPFHPGVAFHLVPEVDSRHPDVLAIGRTLTEGAVPPAFAVLRDRLADQLGALLAGTDVCVVHNAMTLHKNMAFTAALHRLAAAATTPFLAWCHDFAWQDRIYTPDLHPGYPWDLLRTAWPGVTYVTVSQHRRARLAKLLSLAEQDIAVVTPGVDVVGLLKLDPATCRLVDKLHLIAADPLLLLPARITRRKNIEFAIRVMGALVEGKPEAALVVTGPPGAHNPGNLAYLESLRALRRELALDAHVHFLYEHGEGPQPLHVTDAMVADLYKLADLLFFPTRREGFGIPILEAGLVHLPIFAADIPPVRESAGDWVHTFDLADDPAAVARDILHYLETDQGSQLRRHVLSHYTWPAIVEHQLGPLVEEVIKNAQ